VVCACQRPEAFRRKKDEEAEEKESVSPDHGVKVDSGQEENGDGGEKKEGNKNMAMAVKIRRRKKRKR